MKKQPFFSIVIPTYNRATDLQFALFCLLRQTFDNFEIVISDNCSTDNTEKIVKGFKDKRIRYSRTHKTLWNSFNIGRAIGLAGGKYIFLHSDDDFLLYSTSLETIFREIIQHSCGYIRLNYLSLSLDKKHIFAYKLNKPFAENTYISKGRDNREILSFIRDSDPYFISGIIVKNDFPKHIKIVDSDPAPWIDILFYVIKRYGADFIVKPHLIAQWSRRKTYKDQTHHIFSLIHGKLRSEQYLSAVRAKVSDTQYRKFLTAELYLLYVECFPMIKAKVGNLGLLKLSARICSLAPECKKRFSYWGYLGVSLLLPEFFWNWARELYLWLYAHSSRPYNFSELVVVLKKLEREFTTARIFNF